MAEGEAPTSEERIRLLELQMAELNRQFQKLGERVLGAVPILSLPLSTTQRLEMAFEALDPLNDQTLMAIIFRYIEQAKTSGLNFDEMIEPIVNVFGLRRSWKLINHEWIMTNYGEWGLARWRQMGEETECEEEHK